MFAMLTPALTFTFPPRRKLLSNLMEAIDERMVRGIDVSLTIRYWAKQRRVVADAVEIFDDLGSL